MSDSYDDILRQRARVEKCEGCGDYAELNGDGLCEQCAEDE